MALAPDDVISAGEFVFKIIGAGITAAILLRKYVERMIEEKVRQYIEKAAQKITSTNSASVDALRKEIAHHNEVTDKTREEQISRVTSRIDDLFKLMHKSWSRE